MSRDVLDLIDAALDDYAMSVDAMRWAPDKPDLAPEPTPANGWGTADCGYGWTISGGVASDYSVIDETRAMIREQLGPVFEQLGVILTDWQFDVLRRTFTVRVRVTPSPAAVERRARLRRMHSEYHRRTRHRRTR